VWDILGRVEALRRCHAPGRYAELLLEAAEREAAAQAKAAAAATASGGGGYGDANHEAIEKDLGRTFPRHRMFARSGEGGGGGGEGGGSEESAGRARLRRVLRAYAAYDPHVGYCQGMSFFVAMFLLYRPPPGDAPSGDGGGGA